MINEGHPINRMCNLQHVFLLGDAWALMFREAGTISATVPNSSGLSLRYALSYKECIENVLESAALKSYFIFSKQWRVGKGK